MRETSSADAQTLIWALCGVIIGLVVAAMFYAVGIGLANFTRIGV